MLAKFDLWLVLPIVAIFAPACSNAGDNALATELATAASGGETAGGDLPLAQWLLGTWAYASTCETDNTETFAADGTLSAHAVRGSYRVRNDHVEETQTHEVYNNGEGEIPFELPIEARFRVERIDDNRAMFHFADGEAAAVVRCS